MVMYLFKQMMVVDMKLKSHFMYTVKLTNIVHPYTAVLVYVREYFGKPWQD